MNKARYLWQKYHKIQNDILVVYRPTSKSSWGDRCLMYSKDFSPYKQYNHRSILKNEIIIEFDEPDMSTNKILANIVCSNLKEDNITHSMWYSGNRSYHIHFFIFIPNIKNIPTLKKTIMRHYGKVELGGVTYLPDLGLANNNHLIRAEYGVNEKTNKFKEIVYKTRNYPIVHKLKDEIWATYVENMEKSLERKVKYDMTKLHTHPGFQYIANPSDFRLTDDGRERALFLLIHVLKERYRDKQDEFIRYLQDWYKYSSGTKLSDMDIERKIKYHWNREYLITEKYLDELLISIGKGDLVENTSNL